MNDFLTAYSSYEEGYEAGKQAAAKQIFDILDEVDDILDRCAHDNGEMIVRALKELKEKYGVK